MNCSSSCTEDFWTNVLMMNLNTLAPSLDSANPLVARGQNACVRASDSPRLEKYAPRLTHTYTQVKPWNCSRFYY